MLVIQCSKIHSPSQKVTFKDFLFSSELQTHVDLLRTQLPTFEGQKTAEKNPQPSYVEDIWRPNYCRVLSSHQGNPSIVIHYRTLRMTSQEPLVTTGISLEKIRHDFDRKLYADKIMSKAVENAKSAILECM